MTLAEFIRARLDADEQTARAVDDHSDPWPGQWSFDGYGLRTYNGWSLAWPHDNDARFRPGFGEHVARHDPARVLADVATKRRIVDEIAPALDDMADTIVGEWGGCSGPDGDDLLRLLALPYAGHEDYQEEWRP